MLCIFQQCYWDQPHRQPSFCVGTSTWGDAPSPFDMHNFSSGRQVLLHKGVPLCDDAHVVYGALSFPRGSLRQYVQHPQPWGNTRTLFLLGSYSKPDNSSCLHWSPHVTSEMMGAHKGLTGHVQGNDAHTDVPTSTGHVSIHLNGALMLLLFLQLHSVYAALFCEWPFESSALLWLRMSPM